MTVSREKYRASLENHWPQIRMGEVYRGRHVVLSACFGQVSGGERSDVCSKVRF